MMQRRRWLASTTALLSSTRLWAAPAGGGRLLVVFLRGGCDTASLLVPARSSLYRELRPNIAIALAAPDRPGASAVDADWALHPAFDASLLPLLRAGQAGFVPFAGTEDLTRSHFETQDSIELGLPLGGQRDLSSGFLNRLAALLGDGSAIAFTEQLPLALRGPVEVAKVSLRQPPGKPGNDTLQPAIAAMYRHHPLQGHVDEAFELRSEVAREMADEMQAASRNAIGTKGFEAEARRIARLMRERYALGFVDVGGWDTHVGQGAGSGTLATRFEELGRGLAGFADALGDGEWRRTVVVVLTEFGRTMRENGNRGTDHGHGSAIVVLGGALAGRPVAGEQVAIEARTLFQNRDLPVLNDYRAVLGGLMARQFGLGRSALDTVFPGARARDLGLI